MFKEMKYRIVKGLHEVTLENGDRIVLTQQDFDKLQEEDAENYNYIFESIDEKRYSPVFEEKEYNDDPSEVIGWIEVQ